MEFITEVKKKDTVTYDEIISQNLIGSEVKVVGAIHNIRDMADVSFVILRQSRGLLKRVRLTLQRRISLKA